MWEKEFNLPSWPYLPNPILPKDDTKIKELLDNLKVKKAAWNDFKDIVDRLDKIDKLLDQPNCDLDKRKWMQKLDDIIVEIEKRLGLKT
jgi:hypothetical protein